MHRLLGKTDMKVKRIGFGAIPIQRLDHQESDRVVQAAVDEGINFFDTARVYSNSEEKLGRILKSCRNQVYITTKTMARTGYLTRKDLENSLQQLQTDYIDLYLCHNIGNEEQFYDISMSIHLNHCPYCWNLISSELIQKYLNGEVIECKYCNETLTLKEN